MSEGKKEKYPLTNVKVKLIGTDGNAFNLIGKTRSALRMAGYDNEFIERFTTEATSGNYMNLIATISKYVDIE